MSKKRKKTARCDRKIIAQNNVGMVDENTLALAIVKAYQIIESEQKLGKDMSEEKKESKEKVNNERWYTKVLFMLNVLFFPWKINKRFRINNKIYDGILVIFVSVILALVGAFIWIIGLGTVINGGVMLSQGGAVDTFVGMTSLGLLLMTFGSLFTLASDEFSKVSDSNRIYAYSASIIALISCILTVVSILK